MVNFSAPSASERRFMPPAVAVSSVAFALHPPVDANVADPRSGDVISTWGEYAGREGARVEHATTLWLPLVRRTRPPFDDLWALPGGPIPWDEDLYHTAARTLHESVLRSPGYLEQLFTFGATTRSATAQRLVTIAYWGLYGELDLAVDPTTEPSRDVASDVATAGKNAVTEFSEALVASADANIAWFSIDRLPELAFDHADIIDYAVWRLRQRTEYSMVAHRFLSEEFTLAQMRRVHEAILGEQIDPANFRRDVLAQGQLVDTGRVEEGTPHRPARLYRFKEQPEHV
ncbi:NUDIX domain-containing protein [Yaniella flava]|uniref:NUDIX domain-containing protein n=1 Tax=Yaniella flava TaxID=287930 RepID=A0ABN2TYM3_9MICC